MASAKQLAARKAFAARAKAKGGKKRVGKKPAFLLKGKKKAKGK